MPAVDESTTRRWTAEAQAGSQEALGHLHGSLARPVRAFLVGLRLGLTASEVNDAVQDTFLRLFKRLDRLQEADAPLAYTLGIARNVALDRQRKRSRAESPVGGEIERVADSTDVVATVAGLEQAALVSQTLETLDPDQRTVLTLRHINGLTMAQLATSLDCSVPTARARLRGASRVLAGALMQRGVWPREEK